MFKRLSVRKIAIVTCLASVILLMPAAYFFFYAPNGRESSQTSAASPAATLADEQLIAEMILQISEQEIYQTVYALQNFTTRVYGYPGNTAASTYIYNRFDSIPGLSVEYQGGNLRNVIATLPGLNTSSNEIYMVGAHYDSTSSDPNHAPGATDDASGVAIVLEFARIMSQYRFNHTIRFACWNREEDGMIGSANYSAYAYNNHLNIPLYVNLDSSSYDPNNSFILDIMYNSQSQWAADMLTQHNTLYGINFTLTNNVHTCSSDHLSFRQYGYAAVMTHEEPTYGDSTNHDSAHTPNDTIQKVSTLYAKKNGQLCMSALARIAEATNVQVHDVEVMSVTPSKTVAARGLLISISLTVRNSGSFLETFNVTTKANAQTLNQTRITLSARTPTTFAFPWNTTNLPLGNYNITATASPVVNETDLTDNNCTGGIVTITLEGDANGDFQVNLSDLVILANAYGSRPGNANWNPNADIDNNGVVGLSDLVKLANHYGQHYP